MKHPVLETMNAFSLTDTQSLHQKIIKMKGRDWVDFLDHLEGGYKKFQATIQQTYKEFKPLNFCFPPLSSNLLEKISTHLLISEQTLLDDPLYDYVVFLQGEPPDSIIEHMKSAPSWLMREAVSPIITDVVKNEIEKTIGFYLRSAEIIEENRLIPYKRLTIPPSSLEMLGSMRDSFVLDGQLKQKYPLLDFWSNAMQEKLLKGDTSALDSIEIRHWKQLFRGKYISKIEILQFWLVYLSTIPYKFISRFNKEKMIEVTSRLQKLRNMIVESILNSSTYRSDVASFMIQSESVLGSLLWQLSGDAQGLSTDLLSSDMAYYYRFIVDTISNANKSIDPEYRLGIPGDINLLGVDIPLIINIPPERILELAEKENSAYQNFRGALNEKFLNITASVGSRERALEIQKIRESIKSDVNNISISHKSLQRNFARRQNINLSIGSFSILLAGLSAFGKNLDAVSVASGVIAGAGLINSIKELSNNWADYKKDLDKIHENKNYFIWKLTNQK